MSNKANALLTSEEVDAELSRLIRARFPLISISTFEETRVMDRLVSSIRPDIISRRHALLTTRMARLDDEAERQELQRVIDGLNDAHQVLRWSCTRGLERWFVDEDGSVECQRLNLSFPQGQDARNPLAVMTFILSTNSTVAGVDFGSTITVFSDLHPWLDREDRAGRFNHTLVRTLRDLVVEFKSGGAPRAVILISPRTVIPDELSKDMQVIDYPLPTAEQLRARFDELEPRMKSGYGPDCIDLDENDKNELIRALCGLTLDEAENVLAKGLAGNGKLQHSDITAALDEKKQIIRKDGTLDYFDSNKSRDDVGGLDLLMEWLDDRRVAFTGQTVDVDGVSIELPVPKGILMIGVPGGGKSLVAKAAGSAWELPLLRLDIGRIFGGTVGESERNMRRAIAIAESVAPAIMWLDEVEKAFPRTSGAQDAGTSLRVMQSFLTWMQEKKAQVFVVATGNDISEVPPELTRKGRFDEIFYVGLPDQDARERIFRIHTKGLPISAEECAYLAGKAVWYTGAEIEQVVHNAKVKLLRPLAIDIELAGQTERHDNLLVRAIEAAMLGFMPLARRRDDDGHSILEKTLRQAKTLAVPAASRFQDLPELDHPGQPEQGHERRGWRQF